MKNKSISSNAKFSSVFTKISYIFFHLQFSGIKFDLILTTHIHTHTHTQLTGKKFLGSHVHCLEIRQHNGKLSCILQQFKSRVNAIHCKFFQSHLLWVINVEFVTLADMQCASHLQLTEIQHLKEIGFNIHFNSFHGITSYLGVNYTTHFQILKCMAVKLLSE